MGSEQADDGVWVVWRMDESGNQFVVKDGLSQEDADRLVEEFTARGHKQIYWAELKN